MKTLTRFLLALAFTLTAAFHAEADTFGSGGNAFTIDFVDIGNAGNADDAGAGGGIYSGPYGGVPYQYRMGTFEISQDAITKATAGGLANVTAGAWGASQPATNMTWFEAAAFVNWLNTSTGHQAAYDLIWTGSAWTMNLWSSADAWQAGGENLYRHKDAYYFLPSEDEWYKAAYHKNDGVTANYWDYATGSNTAPTAVVSGTLSGTAVYANVTSSPAAVNNDGGLSAYGTMGQNGNVYEWDERAFDGINNSSSENRAVHGGQWQDSEGQLRSSIHYSSSPSFSENSLGFRVASIRPSLNDGLVGHYLFNAYSSPDETGLTGNLVEAGQSIFPGPDRITGQSINGQSGSVRFLGTSDGLKTQTDFSTPESLTVSVWFKADSAAEGRIIESSWGQGPWIIFYRNNAMHVGLLSQTQQFIFDSAQVSPGWHCAGFAFDESTRIGRVYLDGIEVGNLQLDTPLRPSVSPCPLWIGGVEQTSERFEGYVDDIRIYNRALSAIEVGQLYVSESNTPPVVSLIGANPLTFEAAASYTDPGATATDAENGALTPQISSNTVVANVPDTYAVTWSASDSAGATGTATRTVNVVDTTAPVVAAHGNVTVEATSAAGATVTYAAGSASDAVGVTSITYSQNSGTVFPIGTTTVTITARDAANNAGTGTFTVTVQDTTAPVVAGHGNVTVEATSEAGATVNYAAGSATDAVGVTSLTYSQNSGTLFPIGTTTVTITAKDAVNNTGTGTFTVTVNKLPQSISFSAPATARSTDVITLEASGGDSGNAVTFSVFSGPGSIAGDVLTFTGAGTVVVRASQAGNTNYEAAANVDQTITVALNHAPVAVDDAVTTTSGTTVVYPLANDTDAEGDLLEIESVSNPAVIIADRTLIIPEGFTGTFNYTVTDGSATDTGAVTVSAGTPVVGATTWTGLLYDASGDIAGIMTARKSRTGRITAAVRVGTNASAVSFLLDTAGEATATISLGTLDVAQEGSTERLAVSLMRGADTFSGSLRPSQLSASVGQHNIALASVDAAIPGGGYARVFVKADGIVVVKGFLPDGRSFSHATRLADNGSFVIYALVARTQPSAIVGGEFVTADLTNTDVTGELAWVKGAQARGLHDGGVDTTLTANGCIYTPADTLPGGLVTVTASGGNLAAPLIVNTTATAGVPTPSVAFPNWKVVSIRGVSTGTFSARVKNPANTRTVGATGVYLPKSNSAWGYFPGTTEGGRIEITQP